MRSDVGPGGGGGETVFQAKLGLQQLVDAANDIGDDRVRGEEDPALDTLLGVISLEKAFIEADDRVFGGVQVVEGALMASMFVARSKSSTSLMPASSMSKWNWPRLRLKRLSSRVSEQKVVQVPGRAMGSVGGSAGLRDEVAQDAAEDDHGELLLFEADPEDAPRLAGDERTELLDLPSFDGVLGVEAEFLGGVLEGEFVHIIRVNGPIELIPQILDQGREGLNGAELVGVGLRGHRSPG